MKKNLATLALAVFVGVLGFAISGVAVAAGNEKKPSPPGQGECGHGNSSKPCKEDPQPDRGKDCEQHGNHGGVNEDHCAGGETTTPTDTTPTDTTPTDTTPTDTTPSETTPQDTVPTDTSSTSTTSSAPPSTDASAATSTQVTDTSSGEAAQTTPASVASSQAAAAKKKAAVKNDAAVLGETVEAAAPKPNKQAQRAPVTL